MPKVKTTYTYKIQCIVKEFPDEFMERLTINYIAIWATVRFLVDSHRNTSKHQTSLGSRSENLISQTLQTFLRSSDTDFVEKVTKAFFLLIFFCTR